MMVVVVVVVVVVGALLQARTLSRFTRYDPHLAVRSLMIYIIILCGCVEYIYAAFDPAPRSPSLFRVQRYKRPSSRASSRINPAGNLRVVFVSGSSLFTIGARWCWLK